MTQDIEQVLQKLLAAQEQSPAAPAPEQLPVVQALFDSEVKKPVIVYMAQGMPVYMLIEPEDLPAFARVLGR